MSDYLFRDKLAEGALGNNLRKTFEEQSARLKSMLEG
jgi:hypothetical protein